MLRLLLLPFQWLFLAVTSIRKLLYFSGILKRHSYPIPVLCFGNLNSGGSGKTPHVKHFAHRLHDEGFKVAVILRGYKRKSKGVILCRTDHSVMDIGDEAYEYVHTLPQDIPVVVARRRHKGILFLLKEIPHLDVILMDDGYQHLSVKAHLYFLLTDFFDPFFKNHVLPVGNLREPISARRRADFIIVTKTPKVLSPLLLQDIVKKLNPFPHQQVYFSYFKTIELISAFTYEPLRSRPYAIFLVTGIQNPDSIEEELKKWCTDLKCYCFQDHHVFKQQEIQQILHDFDRYLVKSKILVTTDKDLPRLLHAGKDKLKNYPIFVIKSHIAFHNLGEESFEQKIINYVRENSRNKKVHCK